MAIKWEYDRQNLGAQNPSDVIVTEDNQQIINLDISYVMGIDMVEVYVNGIHQQQGVFEEWTADSIKKADQTIPLLIGDVVSVRYKYSNISLGDIRVVPNYHDLTSLYKPLHNEVVLVLANKRMYLYNNALGWQELFVPFTTKNLGLMLAYEKQIITNPAHVLITLTEITYTPNANALMVFVDGQKIPPSEYTELDNLNIVFHNNLGGGTHVVEIISMIVDSWEDNYSHKVNYERDYKNRISAEEVIFNGNSIKRTEYTYDSDDNIIREITVKGTKTIIRDYIYVNGDFSNIDCTVIV